MPERLGKDLRAVAGGAHLCSLVLLTGSCFFREKHLPSSVLTVLKKPRGVAVYGSQQSLSPMIPSVPELSAGEPLGPPCEHLHPWWYL